MAKKLVIVESPTKARTIRKFLPETFLVESSMGHVRDLPQSASDIPAKLKKEEWTKLGVNVEENFAPLYIVPRDKKKVIKQLKEDLQSVDELYLATDEDREGESISWHLIELLKPEVQVKRMVFHEITKGAITEALEHTRDINTKLVRAQETRRILDRLVGYTLSPLIWKKIAYGLSAGRVQSVAVKIIVDRERARMKFRSATYWGIEAELAKDTSPFAAKCTAVDGKRVATGKDFTDQGAPKDTTKVTVLDGAEAKALAEKLKDVPWTVTNVEEKPMTSRPAPPFITSTLQQEANRKLHLSSRDAMRVAQRLYEEGLITYMRTDSPNLSKEGLAGARTAVERKYGKEYLSDEPRQFKAKSRGAQEAHEAIRPAGSDFAEPAATGLSGKEKALYELIWKRALASQMAEAKKQSMTVTLDADGNTFVANGNRIVFPGFLRVYVEGSDDPEAQLEDTEVVLPKLAAGDTVDVQKLTPTEHATKPPARFTEATLVKSLEENGVGRPSTYASIISTILERNYVRKEGSALIPTFTAFGVTQLLEKHFANLVDENFTSTMERALDEIAEGKKEWLPYLKEFYASDNGLKAQVEERESDIDPKESRTITLPQLNNVDLRIGRYGAYLVKENGSKGAKDDTHVSVPEDLPPADLTEDDIAELIKIQEEGPKPIGKHPDSGENIYCLTGRYGPYVQLGEAEEGGPKPRRASLPKGTSPKDLTMEIALKLLSLPKVLGQHPDTGNDIVANIGRFGPYVVHDGDFRSLKKEDDVYAIELDRALELLAQEKRGRRNAKVLKDLGLHPKTKKPVHVLEGKYGPYVKIGTKNASLPKGLDPENVTMEDALALITARSKRRT